MNSIIQFNLTPMKSAPSIPTNILQAHEQMEQSAAAVKEILQ